MRYLKTSIAYALTLGSSAALASIDASGASTLSFQVICTYGNGEDSAGTIVVQGSNDGDEFVTIASTSKAFSSAAKVLLWEFTSCPSLYYRLSLTNSTGSGGTAEVIAIVKVEARQ